MIDKTNKIDKVYNIDNIDKVDKIHKIHKIHKISAEQVLTDTHYSYWFNNINPVVLIIKWPYKYVMLFRSCFAFVIRMLACVCVCVYVVHCVLIL